MTSPASVEPELENATHVCLTVARLVLGRRADPAALESPLALG